MKYLALIFFFTLASCENIPWKDRTGYLITTYDSNGTVEKVYNVDKFDVLGRKVSFDIDGKTTTVSGSFKIEKIK